MMRASEIFIHASGCDNASHMDIANVWIFEAIMRASEILLRMNLDVIMRLMWMDIASVWIFVDMMSMSYILLCSHMDIVCNNNW
jgi:hypothetical protein